MSLEKPCILRVSKRIYINLNNTVSCAVESNCEHRRLKKGVTKKVPEADDYETYTADTVSFYFIAGTGLTFRVGEEITDKDFARIDQVLNLLQFIDRNTANQPDHAKAK